MDMTSRSLAWRSQSAMEERAMSLPSGPATLREVFQWPQTVADGLSADEAARFEHLLQSNGFGCVIYSDYSGIESYRECLEATVNAMIDRWNWDVAPDVLSFSRSCDKSPVCQRVLKQSATRATIVAVVYSRTSATE